jgi:hypothetical protein
VTHPLIHRLVTLLVVLTLLLAISLALDPLLGRPDTTCVVRGPQLLGLWDYPPECN